MATQQLPTTLPYGWESDYDGTSERWFFIHRPTGYSQFFFPKAGDEHSRVVQLAQPQPQSTNDSLTVNMEAMTISENTNLTVPNQNATTMQQPQQNIQAVVPVQHTSTPHPMPIVEQDSQGSPLAQTVSGNIQRKAVARRDSVHTQVSQSSNQSAGQMAAAQQYQHTFNSQPHSQNTTQVMHNVQHVQQAQQFGEPQVQQTSHMQPGAQFQQTRPTTQYYQNHQHLQVQQPQQPQTQLYQQVIPHTQVQQSQQNVQYQPAQPAQIGAGQPAQNQELQSPVQSSQPISTIGQVSQQAGQIQYIQPVQQVQHYENHQVQPQYVTTPPQLPTTVQNTANSQRRFSTVPVLQHSNTSQIVYSPHLSQQHFQETRHSSIGADSYQSQPLIQQMQPVAAQPGQFVPASQTFVVQQGTTQIPTPSATQYVQQNVAPLPPNLPPPAPGMQWVLVQPGPQPSQVPAQTAQKSFDPNLSPQYSVQMQQFQGGPAVAGTVGRPGIVTRLSSSSVSSGKKALEASKGFIKKHPGKTMAIVGGLGLVAEACGVNVISDAVAGSKVYVNVQNARNKRKAIAAAHSAAHHPGLAVNQSAPAGHVAGTPQAVHQSHQGIQQYPQSVHPHNATGHMANSLNPSSSQGEPVNLQQLITPQLPVQQALYQQALHLQHVTYLAQQQQQQHHFHHLQSSPQQSQSTDPSNQFFQNQNQQNGQPTDLSNQIFQNQYQQNGQSTDPSNQFFQNQISQPQYDTQQGSPQQYVQPMDEPGQNSGDLSNFLTDAYNIPPGSQTCPPSQPQSPSLSTTSNQASLQQQQLSSQSPSPFDTSAQMPQFPAPSTSPFDPTSQQQAFSNPSPSNSPFDPPSPLAQQLPDPASTQIANQAIDASQPFTNDLMAQSVLNVSIQDDASYITSPSPTPLFIPSFSEQGLLDASVVDDYSYVAPLSPALSATGSFGDQGLGCDDAVLQGIDDQDAAIF